MINNSYTIYNKVGDEFHNFEIDRRKLYNYMKDNTGLSCYYDNNSHQGVKIYYMFNEHKNGICKCEKNCILKSNKKLGNYGMNNDSVKYLKNICPILTATELNGDNLLKKNFKNV